MKCVNCSTEIEARYCPDCGQPADVKRISFRQVFDDIQSKYLGLDNSFMRTVIDATIRPGRMFQAVLDGNRRRYIGAGGYLFIMLSLMLLVFDIFEVDSKAFYAQTYTVETGDPKVVSRQQAFSEEVMNFISEYMRLITFLMLPIYASFSRYIFRKSGLHFIEHIALYAYAHAHPLWISILGGLIFAGSGINLSGWLFPISILYNLWFFMNYFTMYSVGRRLVKTILAQFYALLTLGTIGIVTAIIYIVATQS